MDPVRYSVGEDGRITIYVPRTGGKSPRFFRVDHETSTECKDRKEANVVVVEATNTTSFKAPWIGVLSAQRDSKEEVVSQDAEEEVVLPPAEKTNSFKVKNLPDLFGKIEDPRLRTVRIIEKSTLHESLMNTLDAVTEKDVIDLFLTKYKFVIQKGNSMVEVFRAPDTTSDKIQFNPEQRYQSWTNNTDTMNAIPTLGYIALRYRERNVNGKSFNNGVDRKQVKQIVTTPEYLFCMIRIQSNADVDLSQRTQIAFEDVPYDVIGYIRDTGTSNKHDIALFKKRKSYSNRE